MNVTLVRNKKFQFVFKMFTALLFTLYSLYTIYHTFLFAVKPATGVNMNLFGRITDIIIVLIITIALWLELSHTKKYRKVRSVLLCGALSLSFILNFFYAVSDYSQFDSADISSVLSFAVLILSQLAILLFLIYYYAIRYNTKLKSKRKWVIAFLSIVITLYVSCLIIECVLQLKHRVNSGYMLENRIFYYFCFICMSVSFMLPRIKRSRFKQNFILDESEDNIIAVSPDRSKSRSDKEKWTSPTLEDAEIVFSTKGRGKHSRRHRR